MSSLRAWSMKPGTYNGQIQEFVAGAVPVIESRVLALPHGQGALQALELIVAVPTESEQLAKLTAEHETNAAGGVAYFARWAALMPSTSEPYALARLDLRFDGASAFEARLLFDVFRHTSDLWAAAHTGCVGLSSPDRFPYSVEIMTEPQDMPSALVVESDASPLADLLAALGVPDPFIVR